MARQWVSAGKGVRYYEHPTEIITDPIDKRKRRPARVFSLTYKHDGKTVSEGMGIEPEITEAEVLEIAVMLAANRKQGLRPATYAELKAGRNHEYLEQQAKAKQDALNTWDTFFHDVFIPGKRLLMLEGKVGKKHFNNLLNMNAKYASPFFGSLTFDQIEEKHFNQMVEVMRTQTEKTRRIRDYDKEEEHSQNGADKRKKRFYKFELVTEPALTMKTVQSVKAMCHEIWKLAVKKKLAHVDFPGEHVAKGVINNARTRFFTPEEVDLILDDLRRRSIDAYHYTVIAAFSGLRVSSILNLTWGALRDKVARDTKNKNNVSVAIFKAVKRLDDVIKEREAMFPHRKPSDYIFPKKHTNKKGEKPSGAISQIPKTFSRCLEDLKINADIDDPRAKACFHTLRHTYASWLVQKGMSLEKVADLLGHKTLQMTNRYKHLGETHIGEAADVLNNL